VQAVYSNAVAVAFRSI